MKTLTMRSAGRKTGLWLGLTICAGIAALLLWPARRSPVSAPISATPSPARGDSSKADALVQATAGRADGNAPRTPGKFNFYTNSLDTPAWAVVYGHEFWKPSAQRGGVITPDQTVQVHNTTVKAPTGLNLSDVMDRVHHAATLAKDGHGYEVAGHTYHAQFDGRGFKFSPFKPGNESTSAAATNPGVGGFAPAFDPTPNSSRRPAGALQNDAITDPATQISFRTVCVSYEGNDLYRENGSAPSWTVVGNTAQALLNPRAGLVEHYEARRSGVEVTWVLPYPLPAEDSLVIEAEVAGLSYLHETKSGHHFGDANGLARVLVGTAFLVDARGVRTPVKTSVTDNRLHVEVSSSLLAAASYPVAIDPVISLEFGTDHPVTKISPGNQWDPGIAYNQASQQFLIVWQDSRGERAGSTWDIYGARVSRQGDVLDKSGIAITKADDNQEWPRVASNGINYLVASDGTDYFVVWTDLRSTVHQIYGARVTAAGRVLDGNGSLISVPNGSNRPAVAFANGVYLVVGSVGDQKSIMEWRVLPNGKVDGNGITIGSAAGSRYSWGLTSNGREFLVAWIDYRFESSEGGDVFGARVSSTGNLLDPNGIQISVASGRQSWPVAASDGQDYFVAWADNRNDGVNFDIHGTRVAASDGSVLDSGNRAIKVSTLSNIEQRPAVAFNGTYYLAVWEDDRNTPASGNDLYSVLFDASGIVQNPTGTAVSTAANNQSNPAAASNGSEFLVIWEDGRRDPNRNEIWGARVNGVGAVTPSGGQTEFSLAPSSGKQRSPSVVWNSSAGEYLAVWEDERNLVSNGIDLYGSRITSSGVPRDTTVPLAIYSGPQNQRSPAVTASASGYLVAWADFRNGNWDIFGSRLDAQAKVLAVDPAGGIPISTQSASQEFPAVASDGSNYLVAWEDRRNSKREIYDAVVPAFGSATPVGEKQLTTPSSDKSNVALAYGGNSYLAVWQDDRNSASQRGLDIYGVGVKKDGQPDGADFAMIQTPGAGQTPLGDQWNSALATSGQNRFTVVYQGPDLGVVRARGNTARLNVSPSVQLTLPAAGAQFFSPASVTLNALASDVDGSVVKVEFFANGNKLGESPTPPFSLSWARPQVGAYKLTAVATDNDGAIGNSSTEVAIQVETNRAPTASIIYPTDGAEFTAPTNITIRATASDALDGGGIEKVEFFNGSAKLGEIVGNLPTYEFPWQMSPKEPIACRSARPTMTEARSEARRLLRSR